MTRPSISITIIDYFQAHGQDFELWGGSEWEYLDNVEHFYNFSALLVTWNS